MPTCGRVRWAPPLLVAGTVATGVLSGCTHGSSPSATGASTTSAAPSSSAAAGSTSRVVDTDAAVTPPPFPTGFPASTSPASSGSAVTVRDIRVGAHAGFDRVVFEFGGTGTPGWNVRFVDQALAQGSGKRVPLPGSTVLQVDFRGAANPGDSGVQEYSGPDLRAPAGSFAVTQVHYGGTFEGTSEAFIGTQYRAPFRVYRLDNPTRIVIEVIYLTS